VRLNATLAGASVPAGRLAICSQSGAIGIGLLGHAAALRLELRVARQSRRRLDERPAGAVFRGSPPVDRGALWELILRFALLLRESPRWSRPTSTRCGACRRAGVVLDMRVRVERRRPAERVKTW
jgi:hypothetical protein